MELTDLVDGANVSAAMGVVGMGVATSGGGVAIGAKDTLPLGAAKMAGAALDIGASALFKVFRSNTNTTTPKLSESSAISTRPHVGHLRRTGVRRLENTAG